MFAGKSKKVVVLFHILVWIVLFSFPYLLSAGQEQVLIKVIAHSWIPLFLYAVIFYCNYLFLINKLFFRDRILMFIVANALLIALFIWLKDEVTHTYFMEAFPKMPKDDKGPPIKLFIYVQIISFIIPSIFALTLKITERWIKTEAERKEAANAKLQSELQHLKYQLQPHFFFNSLNNIYSLVDISPEDAKATIHNLSKLMRYLLYETNIEKVSLGKELDFMEKYIELMKLRLAENTKVEYVFPELTEDVQVAPLLFISLIENAFKHGVSASKESTISFEMRVVDNQIYFKSINLNVPKNSTDRSGSGIGLQNLKKRLELIYHNKYQFCTEVQDDLFIAELNIEL